MDMDMDMGSPSNSSFMSMSFSSTSKTPLYSADWTPSTPGAYAGTCIFLILLAVAARLLVALRTRQESRWLDRDLNRRYVVVNGKEPLAERLLRENAGAATAISGEKNRAVVTLSENGAEEKVVVVAARKGSVGRPWRFSVDPVRALLDTTIVGVGYLLMLAVMTMNVGYFLSVLGGVFIGSLAVGRYSAVPEH